MTTTISQRFNVNVVESGSQTLVLAHGFGSDQTAWRYQVAALAGQYRLILFDYLGCGRTDITSYNPLDYSSLNRYAEDLLAIFEELDLTKVIFVAHSVSAMIGMLVNQVQPQRFSKMIFIGASPRYLNDEGYTGGFEQHDLDTLYDAMAANYLAWASGFGVVAMGNPERPELGQEFARSLSAMRPDIAQSTARMIFESDFRAELSSLQKPVLILQSNNDIAVPILVGEYLASHIPQNEYKVLNSQGHLPHMSAPDEVTNAIQSFLAATP